MSNKDFFFQCNFKIFSVITMSFNNKGNVSQLLSWIISAVSCVNIFQRDFPCFLVRKSFSVSLFQSHCMKSDEALTTKLPIMTCHWTVFEGIEWAMMSLLIITNYNIPGMKLCVHMRGKWALQTLLFHTFGKCPLTAKAKMFKFNK